MPYYNKDPKGDPNIDNHPNLKLERLPVAHRKWDGQRRALSLPQAVPSGLDQNQPPVWHGVRRPLCIPFGMGVLVRFLDVFSNPAFVGFRYLGLSPKPCCSEFRVSGPRSLPTPLH